MPSGRSGLRLPCFGQRGLLHGSENRLLQVGIPWQGLRQVQILSHLQAGHLVCHVNARLSTVTALQYLVNSRLMRFRLPLPTPPHTPERARPQPSTCRRLEVKCRVDFSSLSRSLSLSRARFVPLSLPADACRSSAGSCRSSAGSWMGPLETPVVCGAEVNCVVVGIQ